jgi:hypothetical protein
MNLFLKDCEQADDAGMVKTDEFAHGSRSMAYFILIKTAERRFIEWLPGLSFPTKEVGFLSEFKFKKLKALVIH